jgi:hypothetical protein
MPPAEEEGKRMETKREMRQQRRMTRTQRMKQMCRRVQKRQRMVVQLHASTLALAAGCCGRR